jgi:hypothetical protein
MFTGDKLEIGSATGAGVIFIRIHGHMCVNLRIRNEEKIFRHEIRDIWYRDKVLGFCIVLGRRMVLVGNTCFNCVEILYGSVNKS